MSTYKKNQEVVNIDGFTNCPYFLSRYLHYRQTFTNANTGSVVDIFTVLREFCQYFHYKKLMCTEPSTRDAHKDMDIHIMSLQELCDLSQEDLERYLCFLENVVRNGTKTIYKKLNFIKKFYLYLERNAQSLQIQLPNGNPARFLDVPQLAASKVQTLTQKEVELLLSSTSGENTLRDSAMILVLATTGIRTGELINLDRKDVLSDSLQIRTDKGTRQVFLTDACKRLLRQYLRSTKDFDGPDNPVFLSTITGSRLTARTVQLRIERAAGNANLSDKQITARTLRNTAALLMFRSYGEDGQEDVRRYLGCSSRSSMRNIIQDAVGSIEPQKLKDTPMRN